MANTLSTRDLHFRCISLITTLESLLVKDEEEANANKVRARLSKGISNNHAEKERIKSVFTDIYNVRHEMVHKARRIKINMQNLSEAQGTVVYLLRRSIYMNTNQRFTTKGGLIDALNKEKN